MEVVTLGSSNESSSSASVNKDWKIWVVLHGNEEVVADDIQGIGKAIGVSSKGYTQNMFSVLSLSKQVTKRAVLLLEEDVRGAVGGVVSAVRCWG